MTDFRTSVTKLLDIKTLNNVPGENWVKMQHTHELNDGLGTITVHYWKNIITGETMGFKFKTAKGQTFFVYPNSFIKKN